MEYLLINIQRDLHDKQEIQPLSKPTSGFKSNLVSYYYFYLILNKRTLLKFLIIIKGDIADIIEITDSEEEENIVNKEESEEESLLGIQFRKWPMVIGLEERLHNMQVGKKEEFDRDESSWIDDEGKIEYFINYIYF